MDEGFSRSVLVRQWCIPDWYPRSAYIATIFLIVTVAKRDIVEITKDVLNDHMCSKMYYPAMLQEALLPTEDPVV